MAGESDGEAIERGKQARVFALTWLSYASYYLTRKNFSAAKKTIEKDLHVTRAQLGDIDTGYLAAYAGGQFLWGFAGDRFRTKSILVAGMLATSLLSVAFGLSSIVLLFALFFGLNGLAQSTGWPTNVKTMGVWFPGRGRGKVMGWWSTCYQIGGLAAGYLAAWLVVRYTWRGAFMGPPIIVAAVALAIWLWMPEKRETRPDPDQLARQRAEVRRERARVLRTPLVWAIGCSYFFMKLTRYVLLFWAQYYLETEVSDGGLGYTTGSAAGLALCFEAGGFVGAVGIGYLSERLFGGRRLGIGIVFLLCLAVVLPLWPKLALHGTLATALGLAMIGCFLFGPDSLLSGAAAQDLGGPAASATAAGVINGVGSLGAIMQGRLVAHLSKSYSWSVLLWVLGAGVLAAAAILIPFWFRRRGQPQA